MEKKNINVWQRATDFVEDDSKYQKLSIGVEYDEFTKYRMTFSYAHGWRSAIEICEKIFSKTNADKLDEIMNELKMLKL